MSDIQYALGQPGVGLFMMIIIGAIAGWIAEKITASDHGIFTNILVGICGAFVGGFDRRHHHSMGLARHPHAFGVGGGICTGRVTASRICRFYGLAVPATGP
jgi:uncharacterized membrane protein YeaQ/YmgE (transglycosylase-associated protein family)